MRNKERSHRRLAIFTRLGAPPRGEGGGRGQDAAATKQKLGRGGGRCPPGQTDKRRPAKGGPTMTREEPNGREQEPRGNPIQGRVSQTSDGATPPAGGAAANGAGKRKGAGAGEGEHKQLRPNQQQGRRCGSKWSLSSASPSTQESQQPGHSLQTQIGQRLDSAREWPG